MCRCNRLNIIFCLNGFNSSIFFKIIRPIIFSAVKKVIFTPSRKFSTVQEPFHSHGSFPESWKFSANKKVFAKKFLLDQRSFPQTKIFKESKKFLQANFLTLRIQKGFTLQKLSTHNKRFLTHFMRLVFFIHPENMENQSFQRVLKKNMESKCVTWKSFARLLLFWLKK